MICVDSMRNTLFPAAQPQPSAVPSQTHSQNSFPPPAPGAVPAPRTPSPHPRRSPHSPDTLPASSSRPCGAHRCPKAEPSPVRAGRSRRSRPALRGLGAAIGAAAAGRGCLASRRRLPHLRQAGKAAAGRGEGNRAAPNRRAWGKLREKGAGVPRWGCPEGFCGRPVGSGVRALPEGFGWRGLWLRAGVEKGNLVPVC